MDETVTETVEAPETEVVESVDTEVNVIDEMDDAEFAEHFDKLGDESKESDTTDVDEQSDEPKDLETTYRENLGTEAKLDKPIVVKVNGEIYEIDSLDEIRNMIERGTSVTSKFQKLSEDRKALEAQLEELGQIPNVEESNDVADEIDDIANGILASEYADTFTAQVSTLSNEVKQMLSEDPQLLRELSIDYKSGLGSKIMPQVSRLMVVGNLSFRDAYVKAGKSILDSEGRQEQAKPKTEMLKAQPKKTNSRVSNELGAKAIDAMSKSEFDKYFAEM